MTEGTVHHTDTEGTEIKCPAPVIPAQAGPISAIGTGLRRCGEFI